MPPTVQPLRVNAIVLFCEVAFTYQNHMEPLFNCPGLNHILMSSLLVQAHAVTYPTESNKQL